MRKKYKKTKDKKIKINNDKGGTKGKIEERK